MNLNATPDAEAAVQRRAKLARGCGGCGCAVALASVPAGGLLIALGTQSHTTEAMPFGIACLVLTLPAAVLGGLLLYWGITTLARSRND